jgi:hypothetical protein
MAATQKTNPAKKRAIAATLTTVIVIILIAAFAYLTLPQILKPGEVNVTGTITTQNATIEKLAFTNTACGSRYEATLSFVGENSWKYAISLENEYSYNISLTLNNQSAEVEIGMLVLDSDDKTLTRDWAL